MIVFPGGGYAFTSRREAECIAIAYYAAGYNAYVCNYTVGIDKCHRNAPLMDAAAAVAFARRHAKEDNNDPNRIAVIGFSAGGHLAGFISTSWQEKWLAEAVGATNDEIKVNATVLGYPVVSAVNHPHSGSFVNLLGDGATQEQLLDVSLENRVTKDTPPAFIWTTANDDAVPSVNSLVYAAALAVNNIPYEIHVFPDGRHGISVATWETNPVWDREHNYQNADIARWVQWSVDWLDKQVFKISAEKVNG